MDQILTPLESRIARPPPVLTKTDFVRRYAASEFGNASPTWDGVEEWLKDEGWKYGLLFHIRNRVKGGRTFYDVPAYAMRDWWLYATNFCRPSNLYISAMAPTEKTLFQGEVQRGLWGLDLLYTTVAKPMRPALAQRSQTVSGIIALTLVRHFLCCNSQEWLWHLLDTYKDHVVEFSTYSVEWGTVPGFNSVFWEVRAY